MRAEEERKKAENNSLIAVPFKIFGKALSIGASAVNAVGKTITGGDKKVEEKEKVTGGDAKTEGKTEEKVKVEVPVIAQQSSGLCGLGICCF